MPHNEMWTLVIKEGKLIRCHWEKWHGADEVHRALNSNPQAMIEDILNNPCGYTVSLLVKLGLVSREHPVVKDELQDYPLSSFGV